MTLGLFDTVPSLDVEVPSKYYESIRFWMLATTELAYLDRSQTVASKLEIVRTISGSTVSEIKCLLAVEWGPSIGIRHSLS